MGTWTDGEGVTGVRVGDEMSQRRLSAHLKTAKRERAWVPTGQVIGWRRRYFGVQRVLYLQLQWMLLW